MPPDDTTGATRQTPIVAIWAIVFAVLALGGGLGAFVMTRGSGSDSASAVLRPPMPGHGMVMPSDVGAMPMRGELEVHVGDYWFKPSSRTLKAGAYTFAAHNHGVIPHDVMLERVPIKFASPGRPVDEAAPFGLDGLDPGKDLRTRVTLTPGKWELFCSVSGHYMAGQHAVITVTGSARHGHMDTPSPKPMGMS